MIFLSHNHNDKTVVEQFAIRLRDAFGQDKVFYDSWAIQPGDGIVGKMNEALAACELFLFFVSKNSLQSKMVELEWQNAIIKATRGTTRIVPVKLDDCMMPAIMLQTLHIDLFSQGLEVGLRQIVDVASGRNTFQAGAQEFNNLRAYKYKEDGDWIIQIQATHFMEPISRFLVLVRNAEGDLNFTLGHASMFNSGFHKDLKLDNGLVLNAAFLGNDRATVPGYPFIIKVHPSEGVAPQIEGVLHEKPNNYWASVPMVDAKPG